MNDFKWRHFRGEIVLWGVRWYCRYGISYRDLEDMMKERGVDVDHTTLYRWVQHYAPEMEKRLRWYWRRAGWRRSWRIDETYIKVKGRWAYLYRAVDDSGSTIDFYLSPTRNAKAAIRFLGKALGRFKGWEKPRVLNTDKAPAYGQAIAHLKAVGKCPMDTEHRQVKYLNNIIEAEHAKIKRLIKPALGFQSMKTVYATIKGFETMRALRKKRASAFQFQPSIHGEVRLIERVFHLGDCALAEAAHILNDYLQKQAA
jgi:transposase, IS6 family